MISIGIRNARGERMGPIVTDPDFDPVQLGVDPARHPLLSGIDPYGDTVFNGLQARRLRAGLESHRSECASPARFFEVLDELCRLVGEGTHLYLWFIGD